MLFSRKLRAKEEEASHLSDDLKRKISELHLLICGGVLSPEELKKAEQTMLALKRQFKDQTRRLGADDAVLA